MALLKFAQKDVKENVKKNYILTLVWLLNREKRQIVHFRSSGKD